LYAESMKSTAKLLGLGTACLAVAAPLYCFFVPRHRLAEKSELTALLDKRFSSATAFDRDAQARGERFNSLIARVEGSGWHPNQTKDMKTTRFMWDQFHGDLEQALRIAAEPLQGGNDGHWARGHRRKWLLESGISLPAGYAEALAFSGDTHAALPYLRMSFDLLRAAQSGTTDFQTYTEMAITEREILISASEVARTKDISFEDIREIAKMLPEPTDGDPILEQAARAEVSMALDWLPNPFGQPLDIPAGVSGFALAPPAQEDRWKGRYDAYETTKLVNDVASELLDNIHRSSVAQRFEKGEEVAKLAAEASSIGSTGPSVTWPIYVREFAVRFMRNRADNPVGRLLASGIDSRSLIETSVTLRAERRLARVAVGACAFAAKYNRAPADLEEVARLAAVSIADPYSKAPLRYDAKRLIIWSVGADGKDDDGWHKINGFDVPQPLSGYSKDLWVQIGPLAAPESRT
jgi:hypothetical protein